MTSTFLESIFNDYRDKIFGFFISSLGSHELAADLTQDLFYKLCKKEESLDEIRDINSYIFWMAQNIVVDHLRKAAHEKEYRESLITAWKNSRINVDHQKPEIDQKINKEHYNVLFDQLIQDLTPQQQVIITLSKKEGLSNNCIAQRLGLFPNTVKNHLHQALKILRTKLDSNMNYIIFFIDYHIRLIK